MRFIWALAALTAVPALGDTWLPEQVARNPDIREGLRFDREKRKVLPEQCVAGTVKEEVFATHPVRFDRPVISTHEHDSELEEDVVVISFSAFSSFQKRTTIGPPLTTDCGAEFVDSFTFAGGARFGFIFRTSDVPGLSADLARARDLKDMKEILGRYPFLEEIGGKYKATRMGSIRMMSGISSYPGDEAANLRLRKSFRACAFGIRVHACDAFFKDIDWFTQNLDSRYPKERLTADSIGHLVTEFTTAP